MLTMFGSPTLPQLFYSRRIGAATPDPTLTGTTVFDSPGRAGTQIWGAAKVAGRLGNKMNVAILDSVTAPESAIIVYSDNGTKSSGRIAPMTNFFIGRLRADLSDSLIGSAMFTSVLRREPTGSVGIDNLCPNGKRGPDGRCTRDATTAELDLRYTSPDSSWLAFAALMGS